MFSSHTGVVVYARAFAVCWGWCWSGPAFGVEATGGGDVDRDGSVSGRDATLRKQQMCLLVVKLCVVFFVGLFCFGKLY